MSEQAYPSCLPSLGDACGDCHRCQQTTPRTVEEAAREEAEQRWPSTPQPSPVLDEARALARYAFTAGATWQAARMPSEEEVAGWLWRIDHPDRMDGLRDVDSAYVRQKYADRAGTLLALWGAP